MIGERPRTPAFETLFDWPDSVLHLDYDSTKIDGIMNDLDRQPEREETIRRTNVEQSLLRHDWAYRWEAILKTVALSPLPQLLERKAHLQDLGREVGLSRMDSYRLPRKPTHLDPQVQGAVYEPASTTNF
jgi:hypothetical protein